MHPIIDQFFPEIVQLDHDTWYDVLPQTVQIDVVYYANLYQKLEMNNNIKE